MAKTIQLRHVPDALHKRLKARAMQEGMTLSDFIIREVAKVASRPTLAEMMARLATRSPVKSLSEPPAAAVRKMRNSRRCGAVG